MRTNTGNSKTLEKALDYAVEHWRRIFAATLIAAAAGTGLAAYAYASELEHLGAYLGTFALGLALKYPGRYANAGGTDLDTVLIILVSAGMGVPYGLIFALAFVPLGSRIALERPQETMLSLIMHLVLAALTGYFAATPENIVAYVMAFVLLSVAIAGPVLYYTGHPAQPLAIGIIVKVAWAFAFMNAFGIRLFETLI